jgi:hypothetical protein
VASLSDINVRFGADLKQFRSAIQNIDKIVKGMSKGFGAVGAAIGAAFIVDKVVAFGREASELAGKMEGVENAFRRFADPNLLNELRQATRGTTNDLELMTAAVKAEQFGIPMEQMGTLLGFASRRAQETGQEVDYLVNSIVTGLGRKSPMILDNLGISTTRLKESFGGAAIEAQSIGDITKVVADIAQEEMKKAGGAFVSTADASAQLGASMDNLKTAIGQRLNVVLKPATILLGGVLDKITKIFAKSQEQIDSERIQARTQRAVITNQEYLNAAYQLGLTTLEESRLKNNHLTQAQYELVQANMAAIMSHLNQEEAIKKQDEAQAELIKKKLAYLGVSYQEGEELDKLTAKYKDHFTKANRDYLEVLKNIKPEVVELNDLFREHGRVLQNVAFTTEESFIAGLENAQRAMQGMQAVVDDTEEVFVPLQKTALNTFDYIRHFMNGFGQMLQQTFEAALVNGDNFFEAFGKMLKAMAQRMLATAAAAAILAALITVITGGTGLALTAGGPLLSGGALVGGLFKGMMGIPMLASGGIVTGPTLAMVGEGGGPEAVIPLNRLNEFGGGGGNITVTGRIQGQDILLSQERASRIRSRYRGF